MGEEKKVPLEKCIGYTKGIAVIAKNDLLDPTTMYKLSRLNDYAMSPVRAYEKANRSATNAVNEQIKILHDKIVKSTNEEEKYSFNEEIKKIKADHVESMNELLGKEETIKVPSFKLSEFIAKFDRPDKNITAGSSLVPQEFFTLLGDVIIDDKSK